MADYLLLIVEPEWDFEAATDEDWAREAAAHNAFADAVGAAGGEIVNSNALAGNDHAVRIRPGAGGADPIVTEGPFTEATELVSGYYIITIDSDAEARRLAALCPTGGYIELHPIVDLSAVM